MWRHALAAVPEDLIATINSIVRATREGILETGQKPTLEELAQTLDVPLGKLRQAVDLATQVVRFP
jgi:hypothetical protein